MKLLFAWILIFTMLAGGAIAWWAHRTRRTQMARAHLQDTLIACHHLLQLTAHLQQHRGMSSAWLSGDDTFISRLHDKRREIEAVFPVLLTAARLESMQPHPCITGNEITLFRFRWQSLVESLPGMPPETSIAQHSFMISQVLEWLLALGEARIEPLGGTQMPVGLIRNYAHRLPMLTECLGQARAIGSSVAARHGCTPVARVRLMFLISRSEALLEQAATAHGAGGVGLQARLAVQEMARIVRTSLLLSSGITVTPDEYFAVATQAISRVYEWIEACSREISSASVLVERRMAALEMIGGG